MDDEQPLHRVHPSLRPDLSADRVLRLLNEAVAETPVESGPREATWTLHVMGTPRSGTTLAAQVLVTASIAAPVTNLMAMFWRNAPLGAFVTRHLSPEAFGGQFESTYGRTRGAYGAHEFGRFWTEALGQTGLEFIERADAIDWPELRRTLDSVTTHLGPVVFKSFLLGTAVGEATRRLPRALFVWTRRDIVETAASLLVARERYAASADTWVGIRPLGWQCLEEASVPAQCLGQALMLDTQLANQVERADPSRVIIVTHDLLVSEPRKAASLVAERLGALDPDLARTLTVERLPAAFERSHPEPRARQAVLDARQELVDRAPALSNALARLDTHG